MQLLRHSLLTAISFSDCGNELGEDLQDEVRKSMIGAYLSLSKHNKMFFNGGIDDNLEELEDKLYAKFLEYIRKFS